MLTMTYLDRPVDWATPLGVTLGAGVPGVPAVVEEWSVASAIPGAIVEPWTYPHPSCSELCRRAQAANAALREILTRTTVFAPGAAGRQGAEGGTKEIPHYGQQAGGVTRLT